MRRATARVGGILVALALFATGCGGKGDTPNGSSKGDTSVTSSLNYDQAKAQAVANAEESLHALPASAKLAPIGPVGQIPCSDDDGAPASTPVSIQADYFVSGLDATKNKQYVDDLVRFWSHRGWSVSADRRPDDQFVTLHKSGFEVVMQLTADGQRLGLSATSPCVAPKGSS